MAKQVAQALCAGIDDGRAYTKIYFGNGRKLKIRTSVKPGVHAGSAGLAAEAEQAAGIYEVGGQQYTVGDRVDGEDTRFEDFDGSHINLVAVHHALMMAGFSGQDVSIATGLPVFSYYHAGAIDIDFINKKREKLMTPVTSITGSRKTANIVRNIVCSEALSAWLDDVLDENGDIKPDADMEHPVGVVDFGGRTLDTLWINPPDMIDHAHSGSESIGVLNLFDLIESGVRTKFRVNSISRAALESAANTRILRLYGESHDVSDIVEKASNEVIEMVEREIQRRFGNAAELERILFVGGGSAVLPGIAARYRNAKLVEDPEYANARGMYKFLKNTMKHTKV